MASLIILPASMFVGDEDAQLVAGDVAASPENIQSSRIWWAFDDTEEEAIVSAEFSMPTQYTGPGLVAIIHGFFKTETTVTSEAVIDVFVEAKTPNSDTLDMEATASWAAANPGEIDPGGTAGDPVKQSIALTNADSVAVGDSVRIGVRRDTDEANDIASGDFCITFIELQDDG